MNKQLIAGLIIGAILGYLWKQERVTSSIVIPTTGGEPIIADWYLDAISQGY